MRGGEELFASLDLVDECDPKLGVLFGTNCFRIVLKNAAADRIGLIRCVHG